MSREATPKPDVNDGAENFIRRFCFLPETAYLTPAAWTVTCRRMQRNFVRWQEQPK